ncbi:MAG: type III-B CRISPR module RAMP protein Cmr6 [Marinifilaceae bacterium]|jgi:CRISPR-associated protein Cmr6|nr:type III-B CRISPR module RAMP protein Cmr6 [Marinifilaceae bacterium]
MSNLGLLYYKEYYRDIISKGEENYNNTNNSELLKISEINDRILNYEVSENSNLKISKAKTRFNMKTLYPGLLLGSGYCHDYKDEDSLENNNKGEDNDNKVTPFKVGFYFDYTTGLPLIPGSSIKGFLRSFFPNKYKGKLDDELLDDKISLLQDVIKESMYSSEGSIFSPQKYNKDFFYELEEAIFDGIVDGKKLSLYDRDIFFDAYPTSTSEKKIFSEDYITPHKTSSQSGKDNKSIYCDELKNPIPIKFLKIQSEVEFEFQFSLKDTKWSDGTLIKAKDKKKIFILLISYFGLGAKTNIGYGRFAHVDNDSEDLKEKSIEAQEDAELVAQVSKANIEQAARATLDLQEENKRKDEIEEEKKKKKIEEEKANLNLKRKREQKEAQEEGISLLTKINDPREFINKTKNWVSRFYEKPNIHKIEDMQGKFIPKEYKSEYLNHIKELKNEAKNLKQFIKANRKDFIKIISESESIFNNK